MNAKAFLQLHWRVAVLALASVVLLGLLAQGLAHLLDGKDYDAGRYDAGLAVARAHEHVVHHERDSVSKVAREARVVYVSKRREATDAIAALPPATITIDSITLPQGTFAIPFPVALYITQLRLAVAKSDTALRAADTALVKTVAAQEKSDSLASASSVVADIATARVEQQRPGFFKRAWDAVKVPLAFVGGVTVGVVVGKAVP